ncbi:MAG: aspartate aminotransferase family protein [Chromatiales bacterium]|nr:aspartate aminotransferase family protein [Chromatiales bacterium]
MKQAENSPGSALIPTYRRQEVAFERGAGAWLTATDGRRYLDALSGVAVCGLGHAHPTVSRAIAEQAATLVHTSNLYRIPLQEQLGARLCAASGMSQAFFCNSGAEANEAAIKIARRYGHGRGIELPQIVVMDGSFHGRTLATLSATGNRKVQAGFEPLVQGFVRAPYGDAAAVRHIAATNPNIVAVLVEPVQGEGGVKVPPAGYLSEIAALCAEHEWLLMLDEVQTGIGRTGTLFAFQHEDFTPDVMTLAKGLGNGMPIGACLVSGRAVGVLGAGSHGSTFGGNPLACRAALAVLDVLQADQLPARAAELGQRMRSAFAGRLAGQPGVREVRGQGLMIGIELDRPCTELVGLALDQGLLINVTADRVVRLLPPLILSDAEAEQIVTTVSGLVTDFLREASAA